MYRALLYVGGSRRERWETGGGIEDGPGHKLRLLLCQAMHWLGCTARKKTKQGKKGGSRKLRGI